MRYLIDTHIFLWWLKGDKQLKASIRKLIENPKNRIFVSVAVAWEMSIKHKAGKLPLKTSIKRSFSVAGFELLDINLEHVLQLAGLPSLHKDPFDRIMLAQSIKENLSFVTSDKKIAKYKIPGTILA